MSWTVLVSVDTREEGSRVNRRFENPVTDFLISFVSNRNCELVDEVLRADSGGFEHRLWETG